MLYTLDTLYQHVSARISRIGRVNDTCVIPVIHRLIHEIQRLRSPLQAAPLGRPLLAFLLVRGLLQQAVLDTLRALATLLRARDLGAHVAQVVRRGSRLEGRVPLVDHVRDKEDVKADARLAAALAAADQPTRIGPARDESALNRPSLDDRDRLAFVGQLVPVLAGVVDAGQVLHEPAVTHHDTLGYNMIRPDMTTSEPDRPA